MISAERIRSFIESLEPECPQWLTDLEQQAVADMVPIIRKETQQLLRFLVRYSKPEQILEVGTAVGFSALLMWEASGRTARITTIENYEKRIPIARANFVKNGADAQITLLEGDAQEVLTTLDGTYPMIFMDAAKGQYSAFLPEVLRLLAPGGLLITDNVLQDGDLLESRYAVTRRDRTIHARMREYLYELMHSEMLDSTILNVGDGMALSVKKTVW
ncbi:MAG: O-methyltransferase [Lachnospiraceae bacterium]|nr:O-methyltransferase [Lachnospiraceae bacterium]